MSKGKKLKRGQAKAAIEASLQIALEQAKLLEAIIGNSNSDNADINVENKVATDRNLTEAGVLAAVTNG